MPLSHSVWTDRVPALHTQGTLQTCWLIILIELIHTARTWGCDSFPRCPQHQATAGFSPVLPSHLFHYAGPLLLFFSALLWGISATTLVLYDFTFKPPECDFQPASFLFFNKSLTGHYFDFSWDTKCCFPTERGQCLHIVLESINSRFVWKH